MRIIMLAIPALLLAACNVTKDNANNTVSVTLNQEVAGNAAEDAGNQIENIAGDIGNDVRATGDKIDNKVGNTDVDVNVNANVQTNKH